jgi:hypothetical protein
MNLLFAIAALTIGVISTVALWRLFRIARHLGTLVRFAELTHPEAAARIEAERRVAVLREGPNKEALKAQLR